MSLKPTPSSGAPEQRRWERQDYQTGMVLALEDGRALAGHTLNVSPGGVFLHIEQDLGELALGEAVTLMIGVQEDSPHFDCEIASIHSGGVGLKFLSDQGAFGAFITHDMLLHLISRLNNAFANSLDLKTTLDTSVDEIQKYLHTDGSSLFLLSDDGERAVCAACAGPVDITGIEVSIDEGVVGNAIRSKTVQTVQNVSHDPFFTKTVDQKSGFETVSLLCAPMIIQGRVIGALEVVNKRGSGYFKKPDEVALTALASATALAVHNAQQAAELIEKQVQVKAASMNYDFISSLNHRLHTPLNTVLGFAQLLETDSAVRESSIGQAAVPEIVSAGKNLMNLVDAILLFAELESGKVHVDISSQPPSELFEACLNTLKNDAQLHDISVDVSALQLSALPMVEVDGVYFQKVLENVFRQVTCVSESGSTIVLASEEQGGRVRFSITFRPSGQSEAPAKDAFAPKLADTSGEEQGPCIGLELAITHKLIEMMDGDVDIDLPTDKMRRITLSMRTA